MRRLIRIYDTTLRDGTQGEGVLFSGEDKVRLASRLEALGIHYIEGGWPGPNPKDLRFFRPRMEEVLFDAEHFFDGFRANRDYALATLKAAADAGAHWLVLCDTNGGTLPPDLVEMIREVKRHVPARLGIHVHNDAECAVANSLAAVLEGCEQVQGTMN